MAPMNGGTPTMIPISDGDNPSDFMCKDIKFQIDAIPACKNWLNTRSMAFTTVSKCIQIT